MMQTEIGTDGATTTTPASRTAASRTAAEAAARVPPSWLAAPAEADLWELELSPWARRALRRAGIYTVGAVRDLGVQQVAAFHGVGPKTLCELKRLLGVLKHRLPAAGPRLRDAVDEIVDTVLDAADVEILEDLAQGPALAAGPAGAAAQEEAADALLLRRLMVDVVKRYWARKRRLHPTTAPSAGEGGEA